MKTGKTLREIFDLIEIDANNGIIFNKSLYLAESEKVVNGMFAECLPEKEPVMEGEPSQWNAAIDAFQENFRKLKEEK